MTKALITQKQPLSLSDFKRSAFLIFDTLDASQTTRNDYKSRIGLFLTFINKNGFNFNSFLDFKRFLENKSDYSVSTKNKYLATARVLLKELSRQGKLQDTTTNVKSFKQDKKHKKDGLNDSEITTLAKYLNSQSDTRLRAIMALLIFQGLRQVEIVRLDVSDLDLVSKTALVKGKGRDDKEAIDLHPETVNALRAYMTAYKVKDGALFTSLAKNQLHRRLTTRGLRLIVKTILNNLKINKCVHGFRHYFTTTLIKSFKGNLLEVAQYTRHRSLEMLQVYNDRLQKTSDLPKFYHSFNVSF